MLVVLGLRAVGVHRTTDDALEWSPPEGEESALERQQPGTHDHESGLRYNYVQAERKVGGASGAHGLPAEFADLFGVGGGEHGPVGVVVVGEAHPMCCPVVRCLGLGLGC